MDIFETGESEGRSYCRNPDTVFDRAAGSTLCSKDVREYLDSDAGIDLDLIDVSETSVGAITRADRLEDVVKAVPSAFGLAPAGENPATRRITKVTPAVRNRPGGSPPSSRQDLTSPAGSSLTTASWPHEQQEASISAEQRQPA